MRAAIEVKLVGADDALAVFLAVLGPLLIAGAAVIAALVARRTANERQQEQLAHDTERQKEQLAHDTERQERQLSHDRAMRDRDYLFQTVGTVYENLEEANQTVIRVSGLVGSLESTRTKLSDARKEAIPSWISHLSERLDDYSREVAEAMDLAHPATMQLWADTARLRLVLPLDNEVVDAHKELADATRRWYDAIKEGYYGGNRDSEEMDRSKKTSREAADAQFRFEKACRAAFGWGGGLPRTRFPQQQPSG